MAAMAAMAAWQDQSAFKFQKEKLCILAEMLKISKSWWISTSTLSLYYHYIKELLSELIKEEQYIANVRTSNSFPLRHCHLP